MIKCPGSNCTYKCVNQTAMKRHITQYHQQILNPIYEDWFNGDHPHHNVQIPKDLFIVGPIKFKCPDCDFFSFKKDDLKIHINSIRRNNTMEGDVCSYCDLGIHGYIYTIWDKVEEEPEHLCKTCYGQVKRKKKWNYCNHCEFDCKTPSALKIHLSRVHDIGDKQCTFCIKNVFKLHQYQDKYGNHDICKNCFNKVTGKNSRIEIQMSTYLDTHFGVEFLMGSDISLKRMGGCQLYRPDKIYSSPDRILIIECDEYQHINIFNYTCDEKRISDIYDEFPGKKLTIIRWNPHNYTPSKEKIKIKKKEDKLKLLLKLMNKTLKKTQEEEILIYYMFYNEDNELLSKRIPHKLIF